MKFHENPISGSHVSPCGLTDRRTDMKPIVAFAVLRTCLKKLVVAKYLCK